MAGHDVQLGLLYADAKVLRRQAANHATQRTTEARRGEGPVV